ncbi:DUF4407 domain-containing protein [Nocardia seriolae]|uniref:DUF4407 domain-containing protein n=1 Tax=Nocardia seriolae TaxID=37332 RepID=A0ABC8AKP2_9NOCA|nr:DUF4407 domain-containing protein [Nocardia seriolae]APA94751.1 hypothetical protein NS506_00672 [Nocardia seriolae]MTJ60046.1 DUF4407 domain-containing protein [Nocardia seriolae]MTJ70116.1 DUF4407 domain-containing protein [Nocardia seriolae]MTJ85048.1 DUF4407 domain-containing protein [Nocardia seriolae]MTK29043.1 DUF4407 domain-containing protein [Nocardia seriolae]
MTERVAGLGALLVWLGGAQPRLTEPDERGGYTVTGAVIALFAGTSGVVTAVATGAARWPILAIVAVTLIATLLVGAASRALATAATPDRRENRRAVAEFAGRIAVAVVAGVVIAELACTVLFSGTVHRLLDETAQRAVESAPAVVTARTDFDRAAADRAALDQQITKAQNDVTTALKIARCEYNPDQDCAGVPRTGVPGRGPEERTANQMLDDARTQLATAQGKVNGLDAKVAEQDRALAAARKDAYTDGDRGLGARWVVMNDYTTGHFGPLVLRLSVALLMVVLALLPLLLRRWRGETAFDRNVAVRTETDRIEQAATTAIAVKQAEVRVETEKLRAEQQLTAARLAAHADTAIDRERQRTRIIAAIGNFEIGITEPAQRAVAEFENASRHELPEGIVTQSPNLPAQLTSGALAPLPPAGALAPLTPAAPPVAAPAPANKGGGLELPIIGTVPFTDTAARWIRPLVPSFVASAIDTATHPLRTVRQAFEEAEEITFTLRRTRKVTVDSQDSAQPQQQMYAQPQYGYQLPPGAPQQVHAQRVASTVVDQPYAQYPSYSALPHGQVVEPGYPLPAAPQHDALDARRNPELDYRNPRELPPGRGQE